jgi:pimeloyl-ACP methyl ester carboxylesterase
LSFAARYPQRVTQFVVMDTVPYPDIPKRVQLMFQMMGWPVISNLLLTRWG